MLEKDPLSQAPNIAFVSASDGDPIREASSLASDNTMLSTHGLKSNDADLNGSEFSWNDVIFSEKTNNNSLSCQLGEINHTSSDLDFFGNAENKDPNDFLYYGWPEIGNFEDIDGMLRSCGSIFDLGFSKENESGWLPSLDDLGKSGDVQKLDVKFPCSEPEVVKTASQNHEFLNGYSINDNVMASAPIRYKDSSWTSENSDSCISFATGPDTADTEDGFIPQEHISCSQINKHKKQMKLQHQSEGKGKVHCSGNGSFNHLSDLPNEVMQFPSGLTSHQVFPSVHMQQKQNTRCPDSYNYLQNPISYMHSDNRNAHFSDPAIVNLELSPIKSETTDLTSVSLGDSSSASIHLQYMESFHDPPIEMTALAVCEQREKLHSLGGKCENQKETEGVTPVELGSSNVQGSSTMSLGSDDISLEEASFRQLQLVMEQMTLGMKLCIRDSLYRLAWSAEQRHNHANLNGGCGKGIDATSGASVADRTNRCTSFMYMETDTNPIDRSVAHLLFYRPSRSPPAPAYDSFPCKSSSVVRGSVASSAVLVENSISEERVSEADKVSDC